MYKLIFIKINLLCNKYIMPNAAANPSVKYNKISFVYYTTDQVKTYKTIPFPDDDSLIAKFSAPLYKRNGCSCSCPCDDSVIGKGYGTATLYENDTANSKFSVGVAAFSIKKNGKKGVINYIQNDVVYYDPILKVYNFPNGTVIYPITSGQGDFLNVLGEVKVIYSNTKRIVEITYTTDV